MNDEQMQSLLEEEFRTLDTTPKDVESSTRRVMERKAGVRQRSRWWPFPVFYRRHDTPTATDTTDDQSSPIPASNGHTPTVIGRTTSMLSPVKAITAGAIVFALGGAFLIAQPFQQQSNVPGAEAEEVAATWVTGDVRYASSCSGPDSEMDGDVRRDRNYECSPQAWTASDPRLTGEVSRRWNEDVYRTDEGFISVNMDAAYLRNDEGGWACSASNLFKGYGLFPSELTGETFTCTGEGGYEGLSAIVVNEQGGSSSEEFVGLIFSGDFPPLPEPPAAE
jgi:hypothetical protein